MQTGMAKKIQQLLPKHFEVAGSQLGGNTLTKVESFNQMGYALDL